MPVQSRPLTGSGTASNLPSSGTVSFGPVALSAARLTLTASWTGTPTGAFSLQYLDPDGATWRTVPGAATEFTSNSQAQPAGSAGSAAWTWYGLPGGAVRLLYTATSGTGTLYVVATQGD